MKKRLFGLLLTIITTISLVGCGAKNSSDLAVNAQAAGNTDVAASVSESEDSTLVFAGAGFDTQNFNPALAMTMLSKYVLNAVFDGLTETDENGKVTGAIAESFEESDDHLTYTFNLRKDVKFQNGDALTANDVTYTFDRYLQDDAVNGATLKNYVDSYEQPDDYTIVIHLKKLYPFFVSSIGGIRILPKAYIEENGEEYFNDHPIGTGVYQITEIVPDTSVTLTAIDGHWRDNPDYKTIIVRNIPEASTQLALLKTGEVDIAALNFDNLAELESFPNITVKNLSKTTMTAILVQGAWENTGEAVQNEDVRRALDYAINREDIVNAFFDGYAAPEKYWKSSETGEHWDDSWKATEYDPEKAKELLAEAGYMNGFDLTVSVNSASTRWELSVLEMAKSMWEEVGIRATIDVIAESDFMSRRKSGELACYTAQWMADFNDPDNFIYTFFGNSHNTTFRSLCYPKEDVMDRIQQARTISDPKKRISEYNDLERIVVQEDAAWIPLYSRMRYYVTSERLEGIQASWNGSVKNKYREMSIKQ